MKKLSLKDLKVNSFVTEVSGKMDARTVKGGEAASTNTFSPWGCEKATINTCTLVIIACGG